MQIRQRKMLERSLRQAIFISCIFGIAVLIVLGLYKSMDTVIEKAFALGIGLMLVCPIMPIVICLIINFIIGFGLKSDQDTNSNKPYKVNTPLLNNTKTNKQKIKVVTTEGYQEFNNILRASVQKQLLDRESILKLKSELRYRLGTHVEVYKSFQFQNDIHEIYVLSKSSVLTKDDYLYLTQFISNNLNFSKEA